MKHSHTLKYGSKTFNLIYNEEDDAIIESIIIPKLSCVDRLTMFKQNYKMYGDRMLVNMDNDNVILYNPKYKHIYLNKDLIREILNDDFGETLFKIMKEHPNSYKIPGGYGYRITTNEDTHEFNGINFEVGYSLEDTITKLIDKGWEQTSTDENTCSFKKEDMSCTIVNIPSEPKYTKVFCYI